MRVTPLLSSLVTLGLKSPVLGQWIPRGLSQGSLNYPDRNEQRSILYKQIKSTEERRGLFIWNALLTKVSTNEHTPFIIPMLLLISSHFSVHLNFFEYFNEPTVFLWLNPFQLMPKVSRVGPGAPATGSFGLPCTLLTFWKAVLFSGHGEMR